jgi:hypothetical protein
LHILLIYPGGRQAGGLLLAGSGRCMRVMMPGHADVLDFHLVDGSWMAESGAAVNLGAVLAPDPEAAVWFGESLRQHLHPAA